MHTGYPDQYNNQEQVSIEASEHTQTFRIAVEHVGPSEYQCTSSDQCISQQPCLDVHSREVGSSCADNSTFVDKNAYSCADWWGYSCADVSLGYSAVEIQQLFDNCPRSCRVCSPWEEQCTSSSPCYCGSPGGHHKQDFALVVSSDRAGALIQETCTDMCPTFGGETCNGHGSCTPLGTCSCDAGYIGAACASVACPANCSNAGSCFEPTGRCQCDAHRFGAACEFGHCSRSSTITLGTDTSRSASFGPPQLPPLTGDISGRQLDVAYVSNLDCVWNLEVPQGLAVELHFDYLKTEEGFDFVSLMEPDGTVLANFSGNNGEGVLSKAFVSLGHQMKLVFQTDGGTNAKGFSAWFQTSQCLGGCENGACSCSQNTSACACSCPAGEFGGSCELQENQVVKCAPTDMGSCSGHGECGSTGVCSCDTGWVSTGTASTHQVAGVETMTLCADCMPGLCAEDADKRIYNPPLGCYRYLT